MLNTSVDIRVGGDPKESQAAIELIDPAFRYLKAILSHGYIMANDLAAQKTQIFPLTSLVDMLKQRFGEMLPAKAIFEICNSCRGVTHSILLAAGNITYHDA